MENEAQSTAQKRDFGRRQLYRLLTGDFTKPATRAQAAGLLGKHFDNDLFYARMIDLFDHQIYAVIRAYIVGKIICLDHRNRTRLTAAAFTK